MPQIAPPRALPFRESPEPSVRLPPANCLATRVQTVACPTFESLFDSIAGGRADLILAPLENTLAGPVLRCYDLLYQGSLRMIGEVVLRISHCVIGCPGSSLDELRRIQSHPVALAQCERFFAAHPAIAKAVAEDTAGSVRQIMEAPRPNRGRHRQRVCRPPSTAPKSSPPPWKTIPTTSPASPCSNPPPPPPSRSPRPMPPLSSSPLPISPVRSSTPWSPLPSTPSIS